mgnify:CR=1 FL=1
MFLVVGIAKSGPPVPFAVMVGLCMFVAWMTGKQLSGVLKTRSLAEQYVTLSLLVAFIVFNGRLWISMFFTQNC